MKKLFSFLLVLFVLISVTGITVSKNNHLTNRVIAKEKEAFVSGQFIIGYNDDVNMEETGKKVKEKFNLTQLEIGYKGNFEVVEFPSDQQMEDLIEGVKKEKGVKYAEPNYIVYPTYVPNDPHFLKYQWNFYTIGRLFNGYASGNVETASNYGIQAELAWNQFKPTNTAQGSIYPGEGIKVAVLDTGVAFENYTYSIKVKGKMVYTYYYKAPDLDGTVFDTANARNVYAWPNTSHPNDDHYHGTHICGTIAAATDSSTPLGCAGVAYKATILPVKVLGGPDGYGYSSTISTGIYWAADHGAKIINMSLGNTYNDTTIYTAVQYAYNKGCLLVCAAGNNGNDTLFYPASYSECIAVGATDFTGTRCSFSNYGSYLDIVAPGSNIVQQTLKAKNDFSGFNFWNLSGTSCASPHVAGTAALVWSLHPTWTRDQVRTALLSTARDLGDAGFDNYFGNGLLDAYAAVNWTPSP